MTSDVWHYISPFPPLGAILHLEAGFLWAKISNMKKIDDFEEKILKTPRQTNLFH